MSAVAELSQDERVALAALADAILPATSRMPSASEADPSGKWLARALRARPDLVPDLRRVLATEIHDLHRLRETDPAGYAAVYLVVAGAYYMNVKVRKLIGYPGQRATPAYPDEADYYLAGGVLNPVIERGFRTRRVG